MLSMFFGAVMAGLVLIVVFAVVIVILRIVFGAFFTALLVAAFLAVLAFQGWLWLVRSDELGLQALGIVLPCALLAGTFFVVCKTYASASADYEAHELSR